MIDLYGPDSIGDALEKFYANARDLMASMQQAQQERNISKMQSASHAFAGISGMMGGEYLNQLLGQIEQACKDGDGEQIDALMEEVFGAFSRTCDAWQARVAELPSHDPDLMQACS